MFRGEADEFEPFCFRRQRLRSVQDVLFAENGEQLQLRTSERRSARSQGLTLRTLQSQPPRAAVAAVSVCRGKEGATPSEFSLLERLELLQMYVDELYAVYANGLNFCRFRTGG